MYTIIIGIIIGSTLIFFLSGKKDEIKPKSQEENNTAEQNLQKP